MADPDTPNPDTSGSDAAASGLLSDPLAPLAGAEAEAGSAVRLPFGFARDHQVALEGRVLLTGPGVTALGLREARRRAGQVLQPQPLSQARFEAALTRLYQSGSSAEAELSFDLEAGGAAGSQTGPQAGGQAGGQGDLLEDSADAPVIQLVNQLLRRAVLAQASDLHVEPHEGGLRVRMRIDGFLQTLSDRSDVPVRRVISRLKVMAGLDIAETRLPQDGRIPLRLGGRLIDTRVSSLPGHYGERIVLRILDRTTGLRPLQDLGLSATQEALLARLSDLPNGIILATGPTGSGKTTTLYSLLQLADRAERNIVTVEDPVEYDLPGISQSQINAEIGMSFAAGLRATLRQDPDVILVGEIRDSETASVAAQAALTGHLVFSSLHANSAVGAVVRLRDLGLDDFLIAATLRGVIAQRLLRRICPNCARAHAPSPGEAEYFHRHGLPVPTQILQPQQEDSCTACGGSGYRGRVGIFEMVEVGEALRRAIDAGTSEADLTPLAFAEANLLIQEGLQAVARGDTSLTEALRVVGDVA